ncbi:circumsporozoite protein-like [Bacillus rossius redtenbacheri]|uniref:circumsporozoite protein-like n=1 Tax=Bacillus rossius redtenbacheri TaxID=93214 RepID=UPI002FDE233B
MAAHVAGDGDAAPSAAGGGAPMAAHVAGDGDAAPSAARMTCGGGAAPSASRLTCGGGAVGFSGTHDMRSDAGGIMAVTAAWWLAACGSGDAGCVMCCLRIVPVAMGPVEVGGGGSVAAASASGGGAAPTVARVTDGGGVAPSAARAAAGGGGASKVARVTDGMGVAPSATSAAAGGGVASKVACVLWQHGQFALRRPLVSPYAVGGGGIMDGVSESACRIHLDVACQSYHRGWTARSGVHVCLLSHPEHYCLSPPASGRGPRAAEKGRRNRPA